VRSGKWIQNITNSDTWNQTKY